LLGSDLSCISASMGGAAPRRGRSRDAP
jgi:hypothetical protein